MEGERPREPLTMNARLVRTLALQRKERSYGQSLSPLIR